MNEVRQVEEGVNYTIQEGAEFLRCCYNFLYRKTRDGKVAHSRMGRGYLIKGEELMRIAEVGLE